MLVQAKPIAVPGTAAFFISLSSKTGLPKYFSKSEESISNVISLILSFKFTSYSFDTTSVTSLR
jgi:hypothetical protein